MNYDKKAVQDAAAAVALKTAVYALFEAHPDKPALLDVLRKHSQTACDHLAEGVLENFQQREIALASYDSAIAPFYRALMP